MKAQIGDLRYSLYLFLLVFSSQLPSQLLTGGRNEGFVLGLLEPLKFNSDALNWADLPLAS